MVCGGFSCSKSSLKVFWFSEKMKKWFFVFLNYERILNFIKRNSHKFPEFSQFLMKKFHLCKNTSKLSILKLKRVIWSIQSVYVKALSYILTHQNISLTKECFTFKGLGPDPLSQLIGLTSFVTPYLKCSTCSATLVAE